MNEKDFKILTFLRQDSRMPLTKMSRKTQIPVSTIFDKIKSYEDNIILRHTALIDFSKLGFTTRANISFRVDREDKDNLKEHLVNSAYVNSIYKINNGFDFMIEGIFKDLKEMEDYIELLEKKFKIAEHKSHFIIEDLKREAFMDGSLA